MMASPASCASIVNANGSLSLRLANAGPQAPVKRHSSVIATGRPLRSSTPLEKAPRPAFIAASASAIPPASTLSLHRSQNARLRLPLALPSASSSLSLGGQLSGLQGRALPAGNPRVSAPAKKGRKEEGEKIGSGSKVAPKNENRKTATVARLISPAAAQWAFWAVGGAVLLLRRSRLMVITLLLAVTAPTAAVNWIRSETGRWVTLALFALEGWLASFEDVGELAVILEKPILLMLGLAVAPNQFFRLRFSQPAAVFALSTCVFLCWEMLSLIKDSGEGLLEPPINAFITLALAALAPLALLALA